jgi:hypothetical protein
VKLSGEAKREAPAQAELRPTCAGTSGANPSTCPDINTRLKIAAEGSNRILLKRLGRVLRLAQVVRPDLLPGVANLFRVVERDSGMNPTIRAVTNPIAFGRKVDLIALFRVPDRFAAPIHRLSAFKAGPSNCPCLHFGLVSLLMTLVSLSTKIISEPFWIVVKPDV